MMLVVLISNRRKSMSKRMRIFSMLLEKFFDNGMSVSRQPKVDKHVSRKTDYIDSVNTPHQASSTAAISKSANAGNNSRLVGPTLQRRVWYFFFSVLANHQRASSIVHRPIRDVLRQQIPKSRLRCTMTSYRRNRLLPHLYPMMSRIFYLLIITINTSIDRWKLIYPVN